MPLKGVTVSEERQRFLEDYELRYYSVSDLADRFSVSRRTAHKWIRRFKDFGQNGFHELSRRPYNPPPRPILTPPRSWSPCARLTPPGAPASRSTSCTTATPPATSPRPPPSAASWLERASPAPSAASAALTQAPPSPSHRAPTTS